ncbi:Sodium-coupled monocarboxylate transporter 2 [Eumeta japonica]|uniref:Sodium-coupled monocarboxylate transporter 2 n=1 Tax=Eumeta variegata TaxID=151549 RepID=A0A4C1ZPV1_EUMVA|nr:Sodium-coupled monocarboxylate transporter 2 [Eumeta japonica]
MALSLPLVFFLFVPVYYSLDITSVYQYLELRFGSGGVRRLTAAIFLLRQVLNLAVTAYTPAVALYIALGVPPVASISVLAGLAAVLALLGGLGAAVRADAVQTGAMVVVSVVLLGVGCRVAGGPLAALRINEEGGRLNFFNFTWDLRTRVDTLSALLGQLFMSLSLYGCQQTFVQRYCSMRSQRRVAWMLGLSAPVVAALFSLSWLMGMAVYAVYARCDPLATHRITEPDEVLALFVHEYMDWLPGALGVFLGCLFNGALSHHSSEIDALKKNCKTFSVTMKTRRRVRTSSDSNGGLGIENFLVSNLNSLATVTWEDFVSAAPPFRGMPDAQQLLIIKIIAVIYALVIGALACGVGLAGGVVEASMLATSVTAGPLLGVFLLAVLVPHVEATGAAAGMVVALSLSTWLGVGRLITVPADTSTLPLKTDGCVNDTSAPEPIGRIAEYSRRLHLLLLPHDSPAPPPPTPPWMSSPYAVSYMWYAVFGTIMCVAVGALVSAFARRRTKALDPLLLHPCIRRFVADGKPEPPPPPPGEDTPKVVVNNESQTTLTADTKTQQNVLADSRLFDAYDARSYHSAVHRPPMAASRVPVHANGQISRL